MSQDQCGKSSCQNGEPWRSTAETLSVICPPLHAKVQCQPRCTSKSLFKGFRWEPKVWLRLWDQFLRRKRWWKMPCGFCVPQLQPRFGIRTRNVTCRSNKESHSLISEWWNSKKKNVKNQFEKSSHFIHSGSKLWSLHSLNTIKAQIPPLYHNLATYTWVKVTRQSDHYSHI